MPRLSNCCIYTANRFKKIGSGYYPHQCGLFSPYTNTAYFLDIILQFRQYTEPSISICIMKAALVIIIAIFISTTTLFAQSIKKLEIPEVKESEYVDKALDEAIAQNHLPKGSRLLVYVYNLQDDYFLSISGIKSNLTPIDLAGTKADYAAIFNPDNNLRYFDYKSYKVFVLGPGDPFESFVPTRKAKQFSFVADYSSRSAYAEKSMWEKKVYINFFKFDKVDRGRVIANNATASLDY